MNKLSWDKMDMAADIALKGGSIREIMKGAGISKETAHRVQKIFRKVQLEQSGFIKILTGKRKNGEHSFYYTKEYRNHWNQRNGWMD